MNNERCSCGLRLRSKCTKESESGGGKMCAKAEDSLYTNFRDTPNGGFCADVDCESDVWKEALDKFKEEEE